jgi:hypothetical protein
LMSCHVNSVHNGIRNARLLPPYIVNHRGQITSGGKAGAARGAPSD